MSEENVEVVRRNLESFEDDAGAWLETLDPDVKLYPLEEGHSPVVGHEAALRARESWLETWDPESYEWEIEELNESGDDVVSGVRVTSRGKRSSVQLDSRAWAHWMLRDGKIVYVYEYATRAQALEAAGLSE
jgi:ketosteroid isomerase-like protein